MKKRILGIGMCGFIGTNFYKLFRNKYDIVIFDILDYPATVKNGLWDLGEAIILKGDIVNYIQLQKTIEELKPDYVVNFAAKTHVDRSIHENKSFIPTNSIGVENILECIKNTNIKFCQVSTDEVYGDIEINSKYSFKETDRLNPSSPYSASKASADMFINAYIKTYGIDAIIVRLTNNYGPYQYPEKLIPFLLKRKFEDKTLPIYGRGENIRQWLYVDDCCKAIELVLREGITEEIYNIGGDNLLSNLTVAGFIGDNIEFIKDRPGHDRKYMVNDDKMRLLGWKPEVKFEDGIKITKEWYFKRINLLKRFEVNKHIK